jgi:tetratricopeptide (TPR) repeat protein
MCGSLVDARAAAERALQIAVELADDGLAYGARFGLGCVCWIRGEYRAAIELLTANLPENLADPQCVRDFGTVGSLIIDSMSTLGECHGALGEFDRAIELIERAKASSKSGPFTFFDRAIAHAKSTVILLQRGDMAAALPAIRENRDLALKAGLRSVASVMTGFLGYALALDGHPEEGIALLREGLAGCRATQHIFFVSYLLRYLAECLLPVDPACARDTAEEALRLSREYGYRAHEAESLRVLADVLGRSDADLSQAQGYAERALSLARKLGLRPEEAHALRVAGDILRLRGFDDRAHGSHERARAIYRDLGMHFWLERMG